MSEKKVQEQLFQLIKQKLPPGASFIDVLAEALNLSNDSVYRRIRNETPLVLEEVKVLCRQFSISLDQLFQTKPDAVVFQPVLVDNTSYTFSNYLAGLAQSLHYITSFRQRQIVYLSKDIPFFHYFNSKPLFAFRYFFWMKTILQHPDFEDRTFSMHDVTPELEQQAQELSRLYTTIPSTEIWNSEGINSLLAQIDYYREAGYITSEKDLNALYDGLHQTIEHVSSQAECGCKYLPGETARPKENEYNLYFNQMVLGDNTILVLVDGKKSVYINYDVLNYMVTSDEAFCNETYNKLQNLIRRATILSNVSEKQRNVFFNSLIKKIPRPPSVFFGTSAHVNPHSANTTF